MNIELNLNNIDSIQKLSHKLLPLLYDPDNNDIILSIEYKPFNSLGIMVALVAAINHARFLGKNISIIGKTDNPYLQRMNFFKEIGLEVTEKFMRHSSEGKLIEIKKFNYNTCDSFINDIGKILDKESILDDGIMGCFCYCMSELMDNIRHSETDEGFICVQSYPANKTTELVLVDTGCGIRKSLQHNKELNIQNDFEALEKCIEESITCGSGGRGNGLYHTVKIIQKNMGELTIYSGEAVLYVNQKNIRVEKAPFWQGTYINISINNNVVMDLNDVFDGVVPTLVEEYKESLYELW